MGIPRKNLRKISIHCRDYNYIVKKNDTDLCLTVQEDVDRPGAVMQCKWPFGHTITPEDVKQIILQAINSGWNPSTRGVPYMFSAVSTDYNQTVDLTGSSV